jgi:hypothetical protein
VRQSPLSFPSSSASEKSFPSFSSFEVEGLRQISTLQAFSQFIKKGTVFFYYVKITCSKSPNRPLCCSGVSAASQTARSKHERPSIPILQLKQKRDDIASCKTKNWIGNWLFTQVTQVAYFGHFKITY